MNIAITPILLLLFSLFTTYISLSYITSKLTMPAPPPVSTMLNKLHGQPPSYEKKAKYTFGRTLGAGTYGIVREAIGPDKQKVAIKIILKKNVKGNEQMVYDELKMLQDMKHPHIVRFVDWFESRVRFTDLSMQIFIHLILYRTNITSLLN